MNPKVATIVPANHLDLIKEDDYFMALAHVAKARSDYIDFFKSRSEEGKYVILDNSAVEQGDPGSFEDYIQVAEAMKASAIMLPDYFMDAEKTIEAARTSLALLDNWNDFATPEAEVIVIPQGKSLGEWLECALALQNAVTDYGFIPFIGISCRYTGMFGVGRLAIAITVHSAISRFSGKVHLLGCYADPRKDVRPGIGYPWLSGVDSSYAAVYAQHGYEMTENSFDWPRPPRNIDFINDTYNSELLASNIDVWRKACQKVVQ